MHVFDTYEGNREDDETLAARLSEADAETVAVDDDQRQRSRFRAETESGTEVGVVLGRELRAGDVLSTGDADGPLLEVALEPVEAVVVDLADADPAPVAAVELGHAAGNRHWEMTTRGQRVLFPVADSYDRMVDAIEPFLPDDATVGRDAVSPATFDDGGYGFAAHGHDHGGGHDSDHGHGHDTRAHSDGPDGHSHDHPPTGGSDGHHDGTRSDGGGDRA